MILIEVETRCLDMRKTAKIFTNGRSQAVRLPRDFRFDCEEVYIHKDTESGDVILSKKPGSWDDYYELTASLELPKDFMDERANENPEDRDLF